MINLRLDMQMTNQHPQKMMSDAGISYQVAVPQSIADCWQFFNCENVPSPLPDFLKEFVIDPQKMVGFGLSQEMADQLSAAE